MLFSSVFATRPSRPSLPPSIPFLPSSHSGLSFSMSCTLLSATATSQPFAYQSLRNSFHRHGGCTPSRTHSARTLIPVIQPFYFHTITNCKFHNSILLMVFHVMGGVPPPHNLGRLSLIPYPYSLSFHILAHSFALTKITTLLFSNDSALFAQTPGDGGGVRTGIDRAHP